MYHIYRCKRRLKILIEQNKSSSKSNIIQRENVKKNFSILSENVGNEPGTSR